MITVKELLQSIEDKKEADMAKAVADKLKYIVGRKESLEESIETNKSQLKDVKKKLRKLESLSVEEAYEELGLGK